MKNYIAEMLGTIVLVLMGCGSAIFNHGVGSTAQVLTIAFRFGLSVSRSRSGFCALECSYG